MKRLTEFQPDHESVVTERICRMLLRQIHAEFPAVAKEYPAPGHAFGQEEKTQVTNDPGEEAEQREGSSPVDRASASAGPLPGHQPPTGADGQRPSAILILSILLFLSFLALGWLLLAP